MGVAIAVGIQMFFAWMTNQTNDLATKYFFGHLVPLFLNSFIIFGLFPLFCKHVGLVQKED